MQLTNKTVASRCSCDSPHWTHCVGLHMLSKRSGTTVESNSKSNRRCNHRINCHRCCWGWRDATVASRRAAVAEAGKWLVWRRWSTGDVDEWHDKMFESRSEFDVNRDSATVAGLHAERRCRRQCQRQPWTYQYINKKPSNSLHGKTETFRAFFKLSLLLAIIAVHLTKNSTMKSIWLASNDRKKPKTWKIHTILAYLWLAPESATQYSSAVPGCLVTSLVRLSPLEVCN